MQPTMAKVEHLRKLKQGQLEWKAWFRKIIEDSGLPVDLSYAKLDYTNLSDFALNLGPQPANVIDSF